MRFLSVCIERSSGCRFSTVASFFHFVRCQLEVQLGVGWGGRCTSSSHFECLGRWLGSRALYLCTLRLSGTCKTSAAATRLSWEVVGSQCYSQQKSFNYLSLWLIGSKRWRSVLCNSTFYPAFWRFWKVSPFRTDFRMMNHCVSAHLWISWLRSLFL